MSLTYFFGGNKDFCKIKKRLLHKTERAQESITMLFRGQLNTETVDNF